MTMMMTELVLSSLLLLGTLAQILPRPAMLKQQPVVARRVYRIRSGDGPLS
jgi:hypothetical protein